MAGSCFSQYIGERLAQAKFNATVNPNGIIYNPISIANSLNRLLTNKLYTEKELFCYDKKWFSFDHHGNYSAKDATSCTEKINESLTGAHHHIKKSNVIFITFGSAWVYEHPEFGVVANCHKLPGKEFKKKLLSVKEVLDLYQDLIVSLKANCPTTEIVFTVSPVRHVKDGLHENNLSKAVLHLVVKNLVEQHTNCHYFPAYEIVIDELRDYRFFKDDLVHPTDMAISYVWEKFIKTYCDENVQELIAEVKKIQQAVQHKPFDYESDAHQEFIKKQINLMEELTKQHPFLDFSTEKEQIQQH